MTKQELVNYVSDVEHGVTIVDSFPKQKLQVKMQYRPTDFLVEQSLGSDRINQKIIDSLRNHYSQYHYFIISFSRAGRSVYAGQGNDYYSALMQKIAFNFSEYVEAENEEGAIVPLQDFIYDRNYGMSNNTRLMLVFSDDFKEEITIRIEEFGLNTGMLSYTFFRDNISNIPSLGFQLKNKNYHEN